MQCACACAHLLCACMRHAYMDRVSKSAKRIQADASTLPACMCVCASLRHQARRQPQKFSCYRLVTMHVCFNRPYKAYRQGIRPCRAHKSGQNTAGVCRVCVCACVCMCLLPGRRAFCVVVLANTGVLSMTRGGARGVCELTPRESKCRNPMTILAL